MQITSPKATREVTLRDFDFAFPASVNPTNVRALTLRPEDTFTETDTEFVMDYASGERLRIFRGSLLWMSFHTRVVTEQVKEQKAA